jgi:lipopolysaccharide exporter
MNPGLSRLNTNNRLASESINLGVRAARAGRWLIAVQVVSKMAGLIQRVILARLIAPHDYGLMGIALLIIGGFEALSTPDLSSALIQKKGDIRDYLNSLWTCQIIRGIFVSITLITCAPLIADFFKSPASVNVIRLVSLSIFLRAAINPGMLQFQKDIEFRPRFIMASSASIAGALISIVFAVIWQNVWALVAGILFSALVSCIFSYVLHPFRPKLEFSMDKVTEMFKFGGWLWLAGILIFCVTQGDDLVVSRLLGTKMLGYYQMAFWFANLPATQISHVLQQVTFPAYSEMQTDNSRLIAGFSKILQGTLIFILPYAIMVFMLAEPITDFVFGSQWKPMVPALKVLCLAGVLRCASSTIGPLLMAIGKPKLITVGQILRLLVLATSVISFTVWWGLIGTSFSVVLSAIISLLFYGIVALRVLSIKFIEIIKSLLPSVFGGLSLTLTLMCLKSNLIGNFFNNLFFYLCIGSLVYLGSVWSCDRFWRCGVAEVLRNFSRMNK